MTTFGRRISESFPSKFAIISSLLEVIRIRIMETPEKRDEILLFVARELNALVVDQSTLLLSVKVLRVKIERSIF